MIIDDSYKIMHTQTPPHSHAFNVLNLAAHAIEYEHCAKINIDNEMPKNAILSLL